jgi:PAS domain S-box-containing protein
VLILDDSEVDRATYIRYLQSDSEHSYRILEAETLEEGLELWESEHPELVLVDVNLPDGNGLEFLEEINTESIDTHLPVIVLTGQGDEKTAVRAMKLGAGDYLVKKDITVVSLIITVNQMRQRGAIAHKLAQVQQQEAMIAEIALRVRQSLNLQEILNATVREVRQFLQADRALVYQFNSDMSGTMVAESVISPWLSCLNKQIQDNCFQDNLGGEYRQGRIFAATDIYTAGISDCHQQLLAKFQVRANLVVPILLPRAADQYPPLLRVGRDPLWGLLIVHQCSGPRDWQQTNIQLLQRLSVQLAIALQQAELYQSLQTLNASLEQKVEERTQELRTLNSKIQLVSRIATQIRSSLNLPRILQTTVTEIRALLQCDRVIIYQFHQDFSGTIVNESISDQGRSVLHRTIYDPCFNAEVLEPYRQGRIRVINDIYEAFLSGCHQEMLLAFDIRAQLLVPILVEEQLWGMMIASERDRPRQWQPEEVELVQQLSVQVAIAIQQGTAYQKAQIEIAERQKVEALVRESERRYASLAAASPVAIYRADLEGHCTYANDRSFEIAAVSPEECLGVGWQKHLHPEDRERSVTAWEQSVRELVPFQLEYRFQLPNGTVKYVYDQGIPERDANGVVIGYVGTLTDITDRKEAEIALEESQRWLKQIADTSPSILYIYDLVENCNIYVNPAISTVLGFTNEEIQALGEEFSRTLLHPDDFASGMNYFQRLSQAEDGEILDHLYRMRTREGEWRWLASRDTVFNRDAQGRVRQILGVAQDITDRINAEQSLEQRNQELRQLSDRLQLAIKSGEIAIWEWDIVNNHLIWDDQMYKLYGISPDEFTNVYDGWLSRLHPEDRLIADDAIRQALQGEKDYDPEFRAILPDGTIRYIKAFALVNRDSEGQPQWMIGINYDITEEKQAQATLRKSEARLRTAQRIAELGSWEYDLKTGEITWSEETFHIWGLDPQGDEPSFADLFESVHPKDRPILDLVVNAAITKGIPYQIEARIYRPDGSLAYIVGRGEAICNTDGVVTHLVGTVQDLTERKLAEQQLQAAKEAAEYANRSKSEFLANMSHELRTPMNAILGMTEGLQEQIFGQINADQRRALQTISSSGSHLLELINDILDLAKIEAGKLELDCITTDIPSLCTASIAFIKHQADQKRIQLEAKLPPHLPDLSVDPRRIRQVLINLLNNAVKFTPEGGHINLEVTIQGNQTNPMLRIAVTDTGIGIAPENIGKLFQPFIQIDSALNRQYKGTGLGLVLVKRIVELHGGQVGLTSEVGVGSCFTLDLPVRRGAEERGSGGAVERGSRQRAEEQRSGGSANERGSRQRAEEQRSGGGRGNPSVVAPEPPTSQTDAPQESPLILLAEDNQGNINTVSSYLRAKGYRLMVAKTGEEAIAIAESAQPYLILMDIQMPGMDGLEAIKQIRSQAALVDLPIIAVTALAMTDDRDRCLAAGANAYLSKPVKLKQLVTSIQELLTKQR